MGRSAVAEREKGVLGENGEYPGEGFPEVFLKYAFLLTEGIDLYLKMVYSIVCGEEPREWIAKGGIL